MAASTPSPAAGATPSRRGVPGGRLRRLAAALALGGALLLLAGCGETAPEQAGNQPPERSSIAKEHRPQPRRLDLASPAQERAWREEVSGSSQPGKQPPERKADPPAQRPAPSEDVPPGDDREAEDPPPGELRPASAGTNGSFEPPPREERQEITPRTMARASELEAEGRTVLLNGIALAPPGAPKRVQAAISGANELVGKPYIWGGGHRSWYAAGYDCSGAVSYALAAGGFLRAPLTSTQLASWGKPGPGRWITVYANASHTYVVLGGLRWDTVGDARGSGPRWHAALPYPEGFVERHPPGY